MEAHLHLDGRQWEWYCFIWPFKMYSSLSKTLLYRQHSYSVGRIFCSRSTVCNFSNHPVCLVSLSRILLYRWLCLHVTVILTSSDWNRYLSVFNRQFLTEDSFEKFQISRVIASIKAISQFASRRRTISSIRCSVCTSVIVNSGTEWIKQNCSYNLGIQLNTQRSIIHAENIQPSSYPGIPSEAEWLRQYPVQKKLGHSTFFHNLISPECLPALFEVFSYFTLFKEMECLLLHQWRFYNTQKVYRSFRF